MLLLKQQEHNGEHQMFHIHCSWYVVFIMRLLEKMQQEKRLLKERENSTSKFYWDPSTTLDIKNNHSNA